jgi:hypothetical protein
VATSQARSKSAEALCAHLVHAWNWLGLPRVSQMDVVLPHVILLPAASPRMLLVTSPMRR